VRVVFVHGFLGSSLNWGPVIHKLRPLLPVGTELSAVDLLGHGVRSQGTGPLTLDALARDVLSQIPEGPFLGVGHSFGLRPLLRISKWEPSRLRGIVAEDSSPVLSDSGFREIRTILEAVPVPFKGRPEAREFLESFFGPGSRMSRFLLAQIRERPEGHTWRFDRQGLQQLLGESHQESLWTEWADFEGPISMILGGNSSFVSSERRQECLIKRGQKPLWIDQIPSSGHWVHADQPDHFVAKLAEHLTKMILTKWSP